MMVGEDFAEELVALFPDGADGGKVRGWVVWIADVEDSRRGTTPVWTEDLQKERVSRQGKQ